MELSGSETLCGLVWEPLLHLSSCWHTDSKTKRCVLGSPAQHLVTFSVMNIKGSTYNVVSYSLTIHWLLFLFHMFISICINKLVFFAKNATVQCYNNITLYSETCYLLFNKWISAYQRINVCSGSSNLSCTHTSLVVQRVCSSVEPCLCLPRLVIKYIQWTPHLIFLDLTFLSFNVQFQRSQGNNISVKWLPFQIFFSLVFKSSGPKINLK
jgi:hypothetical protein